jgi:hypothetical protein
MSWPCKGDRLMERTCRRSPLARLVRCGLIGAGLIAASLTGCSRQPAAELGGDAPPATNLYIDWDELDWHLDRYVQVNMRDFAAAQNLTSRQPVDDYRKATTYAAEWDSVGLELFRRLHDEEQAERRRLAARHHAEARRLVLGTVHHYGNMLASGYVPYLSPLGQASRPQGVETMVTAAISHWIRATGLAPDNPAAWRDLGYFCGVVGDQARQVRALNAALATLDRHDPAQAPEGPAGRLRRDIYLDLAWLARDQGQPALTLAYLDHLEPWLLTPSAEREDRRFEAQVLRGLAYADLGNLRAATEQVHRLPPAEVLIRTVRGGVRDDLRWHLAAPHRDGIGYMRGNWPRQISDFGRRWIRARIALMAGDLQAAVWHLGAPPTDLELPARLAWRYWQDRGELHSLDDDLFIATRCFEWAAFYRPYMAFFPLRGSQGPSRLAPSDRWHRFYTGYGVFYLCGDRGTYRGHIPPEAAGEAL